jgi:uncharacterized protein (DUF58 family)
MEQFISNLQNIILCTRRKISGNIKGGYKSNEMGNSFDFHGHRHYSHGDDIRKIDWKTFMRTENLYVREFTDQKQIHVNIFLDNSASMDFGGPNKWVVSQMLALGLSYITLNNLNKLSLYSVNNRVIPIKEEIKGKKQFYELIKPVQQLKTEGKTDFEGIGYKTKFKSGLTFIISDLMCDGFLDILDFLYAKGQEVIVIHILSPEEIDPTYDEKVKLIDKETGEIRMINLNSRIRGIYKDRINNFLNKTRINCGDRDVKYVFASTNTPVSEIICKAVEEV